MKRKKKHYKTTNKVEKEKSRPFLKSLQNPIYFHENNKGFPNPPLN
jgi:hypothetical protein